MIARRHRLGMGNEWSSYQRRRHRLRLGGPVRGIQDDGRFGAGDLFPRRSGVPSSRPPDSFPAGRITKGRLPMSVNIIAT